APRAAPPWTRTTPPTDRRAPPRRPPRGPRRGPEAVLRPALAGREAALVPWTWGRRCAPALRTRALLRLLLGRQRGQLVAHDVAERRRGDAAREPLRVRHLLGARGAAERKADLPLGGVDADDLGLEDLPHLDE